MHSAAARQCQVGGAVARPGCLYQPAARLAAGVAAAPARRQQGGAARQQRRQQQRRGGVVRVKTDEELRAEEEDLWQFPDRQNWYEATYAADDMPDWYPARFVRAAQLGPGVREVVLEIEASRERVPLRNAYKHLGQRAQVRINSGMAQEAAIAAPPFPELLNRDVLVRVRKDLYEGYIKEVVETLSKPAELPLLVREDEQPELYKLEEDAVVECGPFMGTGLNLRPAAALFVYPTIVMFCEGYGIATAKALIEASPDVGGLNLSMRSDVRMYYRGPNEQALCYRGLFEEWEQKYGVKVITSTRDSFSDMFDFDDTLMYEPGSTAAIILTGGDEEAEEAAAAVCKEAEIGMVVLQSVEQEAVVFIKTTTAGSGQ